ncbi:MAG: efflux RND transporter periplasmic adaptor subunit [Roseinatronobacter sp.]
MRFLTRSLVALLLASVSVGALGYAGYTISNAVSARAEATGRPAAGRERVFTVRAYPVTLSEVAPTLSAFGEVRTQRALELRAPVGGQVLEVAEGFEDGAEVTAGQLLFRIDPADATAALALARTDMTRAEAELRDAERAFALAREDVAAAEAQYDLRARAFQRRGDLAQRGVATEAALEEAELAMVSARQSLVGRKQSEAQAEARRDQARTALERQAITLSEAERRLADTVVTASLSGILADVGLVAGRQVNTNEQLGRIIDPDALEVSVRVSTEQYLRLLDESGQLRDTNAEIALQVAGFEITSPGRVVRVSATVEQGQSGRRLFVALDAPRGFRPGDFVTVRLSEPALQNVALIPAAALTSGGAVLAINSDNRLEAIPVTVERRQGDQVIVRADNLKGREIVPEVGPTLGAGLLVRPLRTDDSGTVAAPEPDMITLDPERRAALKARVEANTRMPPEVRDRMLAQLEQDQVPAQMVERIESGGGGRPASGG